MVANWVKTALLFLITAGFLGALLRLSFFYQIEGFNYKYFLHAHSHVVLLGWVFNALYAGLIMGFVSFGSSIAKKYHWLFWLFQASVLGMLFAFPVQGYATWSIIFSTLHIILSFFFVYFFLRDTNRNNSTIATNQLSFSFVRWGLLFLVLSSAGPFALGAIMATGQPETIWYDLAIYFFLHFQYNGWISFTLFGLLFWLLETNGVSFNRKYATNFFGLMVAACLPAYALSALWTHPDWFVYFIGGVAALLQTVALFFLSKMLFGIRIPIKKLFAAPVRFIMILAFTAFAVKILLQLLSAFPFMADLAYQVKNFIIGYLHLVFIGFISLVLIGWFIQVRLLRIEHSIAKVGMMLFIVGFVASELYLVIPSLLQVQIPFYYQSIFFQSMLMPIGIGLLLYNSYLPKVQS